MLVTVRSKRQRPCRVSSARTGQDLPYNCDSVIVNVRSLVELLLELGVALAGPVMGDVVSDDEVYNIEEDKMGTYWTPPGCSAVRFTDVATMFLSEVE